MTGYVLNTIVFVGAALSSAAIVMSVRHWAEHRRIFDHPNERSLHSKPTPLGGGLGIVIASLVGILLLRSYLLIPLRQMLTPVVCGGAIAFVSWLDDLFSISSALRFTVHLAAAVATVWLIGAWKELWLPGLGVIHLGAAGWVVTVVWIVGLTNAFNFMDGIDGMAGLQAVIAGTGWAILGAILGVPGLTVIGLLLAGSSAGFLVQNWQPARIFMGDVGAAFLGYEFAALTVLGSTRDARLPIAGALLVWPFIFDTFLTLVRRARQRENIFSPHRSHLYQRINLTGLSHTRVTLLYGVLGALGVLAATAIVTAGWTLISLALVLCGMIALVVIVQRREARRSAARTSTTGGA